MVSKRPVGAGTVSNHPLSCDTEEERRAFQLGERAAARRKQQEEESLLRTAPTEAERLVLHQIYLQTIDVKSHSFSNRLLPPGRIWMEDGKLKTVIICFPAQRNLYHKIFGGFLMRQGFELAWANACMFCGSRPELVAVDDIMFRKSVDIGSLLFLSSQVCYTFEDKMQVRVHAEVVNTETGERETTNTFHFTFIARQTKAESVEKVALSQVTPKTYADGMLYLSGKRHFEEHLRHLKPSD